MPPDGFANPTARHELAQILNGVEMIGGVLCEGRFPSGGQNAPAAARRLGQPRSTRATTFMRVGLIFFNLRGQRRLQMTTGHYFMAPARTRRSCGGSLRGERPFRAFNLPRRGTFLPGIPGAECEKMNFLPVHMWGMRLRGRRSALESGDEARIHAWRATAGCCDVGTIERW